MSKPNCRAELLCTVVCAAVSLAHGQVRDERDERVIISVSGAEQRVLDAPMAISVVDAEQLRGAGPMVNLSEALARVPGIVVANRSNYAQDLQISSRGFGARASFGVRGMRLYSDGIPASGPDGQGQVSHFDLAGASRIEVLRGPFSALYGNSSGGVISLVSESPTEARWSLDGDVGSDGLRQVRVGVATPLSGGFSLTAQLSRFEIDGFRPQSEAQRTLANVRVGWLGASDRVVLVLNAIDQPALDPLGLTRAQLEQDPNQTTSVALPQAAPGQADHFNTRKATRQQQLGLSWRHRFDDAGALAESQLALYGGTRSVTQWQAIPVATQFNAANPTLTERQPGGVIDFDRQYTGVDGRLVWRWLLANERSAQLVAGIALDASDEDRRGFENFSGSGATQLLGVTGKLRRDERNRVSTQDGYAQGEFKFAPGWAASLGLRSGRVAFRSADHYISGGNGDDSGALDYRYTNPVAALQWRVQEGLALHLSAARGFESPTFAELAYRPDGGSGFNSALKAQRSQQWELGAKWREPTLGLTLDAAAFKARTDDEIGIATNRGGRSTFRNVGRTERDGTELEARWRVSTQWSAMASATWLQATYRDNFFVCRAVPCTTPDLPVAAGNRIAGTLARSGYGEVAWRPAAHVELGVEARGQGRIAVNDVNSDFARGFGLVALRTRWTIALQGATLDLLARVDNVADRRVAGSVIVSDANARFFEPAPGRTGLLSVRYSQRF